MINRLSPNDAIIVDSAFDGVAELLSGQTRADPQSFYNLCAIVESTVLHDQLAVLGVPSDNPLLNALRAKHIITDTKKEGEHVVPLELALLEVERLAQYMKPGITGLNWARDDDFEDSMIGWLTLISDSVEKKQLWWTGARRKKLRELAQLVAFAEKTGELAVKCRVPIYTDVMWMPFRVSYLQRAPLPARLYRKLARTFKGKAERVFSHIGMSPVYIPPLIAILLHRCRSRDDIPDQVLNLREEFTPLRELGSTYEARILEGKTLGEKIDAMEELDASWDELVSALGTKEKHTRLVYRAWDVVKSGNPLGVLSAALDRVISASEEKHVLSRVEHYLDIWKAARDVEGYESLIRRVFGAGFSDPMSQAAHRFANNVERLAFPGAHRDQE